MNRRVTALAVVATMLGLAVAGCAGDSVPSTTPATATSSASPTPSPSPTATPTPDPRCTVESTEPWTDADRRCLREAAMAGAEYLKARLVDRPSATLDDEQLNTLAILSYLDRRWSLEPLRGATATARTDPRTLSPTNRYLRFWSSELAPDPEAIATADSYLRLEMALLYCATSPLTQRAADDFAIAIGSGHRYHATHALWWTRWATQQDCDVPWEAEEAIDRVRADFDQALTQFSADALVNDLTLEQSALLADRGDDGHLPGDWPARVVAAQTADGSWYDHLPGGSTDYNWHPTMLAVWYLSAVTARDAPDPGFLP